MAFLRTILALTRPGQLTTVWSNCLAGWWLGHAGNAERVPWLLAGATFLFLGGEFLNECFAAGLDQQQQRYRPIASGTVSRKTLWNSGLASLVAGALILLCLGEVSGGLGLALVFFLVLYSTVHRLIRFGPVLLGICRFFLYVLGASIAARGVTGWAIWCGLALGAYVSGLAYLAKRSAESQLCAKLPSPAKAEAPRSNHTRSWTRYWPAVLLGIPILLALLMNAGRYREPALLLSAILALWLLLCLRQLFWQPGQDTSRGLSGLIAGIVLVDWLAVADAPRELSLIFLALFLITLLLRRFGS